MVELMDLPVELLTMIVKNLDLKSMKQLYPGNRILRSILTPEIEGLSFVVQINNITNSCDTSDVINRGKFILDSITSRPFLRQFVVRLGSEDLHEKLSYSQQALGPMPFEESNPDVVTADEAHLYGISRRSRISKEHRSIIASNRYLYGSLRSFPFFSDIGCKDERKALEEQLAIQHEDPTNAHLLTVLPELKRLCITNDNDLVCIYNMIVRTILSLNQCSGQRFLSSGIPLSRLTRLSLEGHYRRFVDIDMIRWFLRLPNFQSLYAEDVVDHQVSSGVARMDCGFPSKLQALSLVQSHVLESTLLDEIRRANRLTFFVYSILHESRRSKLNDTSSYYHNFAAIVEAFRDKGNVSLKHINLRDQGPLSHETTNNSIVSLKDFQKLHSLTCNLTDLLPSSSNGKLSAVLPESLEYLELHGMQTEDVEHQVLPFLQHEKKASCPLLRCIHLHCDDGDWDEDQALVDNLTSCLLGEYCYIQIRWPHDSLTLETPGYYQGTRY